MALPKSRSAKAGFWLKHIKNWQSSGMFQKDYCTKHGLNTKSFWRWKSILLQPSSFKTGVDDGVTEQVNPESLMPLSILPEITEGGETAESHSAFSGLRLHTPGNYVIELSVEFNTATLRQLLSTLD